MLGLRGSRARTPGCAFCLAPRRRPGRGRAWCREQGSQFENTYFTEMCSGSEEGSYLRLIDVVYHSTLGLREIKRDEEGQVAVVPGVGCGVKGVGCRVWGVGCRV